MMRFGCAMMFRTLRDMIALPELRKLIDALDGSIVAPVFSTDDQNFLVAQQYFNPHFFDVLYN
ncbi:MULTISPECIES: hypothetical protein [Okeania]|uniref:hypothetical protein n=2 Tax=Okeania TaxID=1458928 RepID=UPI000F5202C9|nr:MULTISPECIES: hypothetical protein [Okeania]NES92609.1 hypothetical protein [Okeania sp. SIO2B9]NET74847.1 hypothetical protein [Okeania sp. SIO1F9]